MSAKSILLKPFSQPQAKFVYDWSGKISDCEVNPDTDGR
jgi:hypothetical protein